ncbi:hypothetical protein QYE76_038669 [Lolium multiflorum]|uniref:Uncharacterized protein n=1 Tax=Lolium multiflorum TaxID=4521 RepID=A0AAD8WT34_LOLMU|nr:hypothetical protein QYE76_038669 [Lolium multiflorum]
MPNEVLREALRDADSWDEARIEAMLREFLEDMKNERLEEAGWPLMLPAYSMSKMVVNLYTRILARRHPEMRVNCVHPGFVKTEINWNTGVIPPRPHLDHLDHLDTPGADGLPRPHLDRADGGRTPLSPGSRSRGRRPD